MEPPATPWEETAVDTVSRRSVNTLLQKRPLYASFVSRMSRKEHSDDQSNPGHSVRGRLAQLAIKLQAEQRIGAGGYERRPDRMCPRNGHQERIWKTRAGEIPLHVVTNGGRSL